MTATNPLLTPTWNRHHLNDTDVTLPDMGCTDGPVMADADAVSITVPETYVALEPQDFDTRWASFEEAQRTATANRVTVKSTPDVSEEPFHTFAQDKEHLDVPARNAIPRGAADYALGDEAVEWMWDANLAAAYVALPPFKTETEPVVVRVKAQPGAVALASLEIVACEGAEACIVLEADSPVAGEGTVGINLRIIAEDNARVQVKQLQTLGDSWVYLESFESKVADNAKIIVDQTYLGGKESYIGNGHALMGFRSDVDIDTSYLAAGASTLDFNYLIRQFGKQTNSKLIANGVLAGTAIKNLRGTIDLIHGAKGAHGHELENVLLTNQGVHNRSLPIILCDEDDVQGDHGASIGHVPAEQRYYLGSRGLSDAQIDALFLRSTFERALVHAHDDASRTAINRLATQVLGEPLADHQE